MRAGDLDRLVRLEQNTPTRSPTGAEVDSWGLVAEIWARRMDGRGREFFSGAEVTGEAATVFRIRWRADVRAAMRIVDGSDIWDIQFTQEIGGRQEGLDVACIRQGA